jgi:peptidyl-prolyl cis-trans isomerase SurA
MKSRRGNLLRVIVWAAAAAPAVLSAQGDQTASPASASATPAAQTPDQSGSPQDNSQVQYTNAIAAIVNDKVITLDQLKKEMRPLVPVIAQNVSNEFPDDPTGYTQEFHKQMENLEKELLHSMADRILIIQEFHDTGYQIPQSYMDRVFEDSLTKNPEIRGDHEKYLQYLQENQMTERDYRQQLEDDQIVDFMRGQFQRSVTGISPDRIKAYYDKNQNLFAQDEEVQLRQITLKPVADETPELLQQQAAYIVQQAREPKADFAELARKYSQDEYAKEGGEAGWYPRNRLLPVLEDVAFKLAPGQVSDPVSAGGNFYIFLSEDKHAKGIKSLDDVRTLIETNLEIQDTRQAEEKWLTRLRKNAYIHYNIGGNDDDTSANK